MLIFKDVSVIDANGSEETKSNGHIDVEEQAAKDAAKDNAAATRGAWGGKLVSSQIHRDIASIS